jgi:glycosyltransferase involved in cell wall biosynthesis
MKILVATTSFPSTINSSLAVAGKFILYECLAYEKSGAEVEVITPDISVGPKEQIYGEKIGVHRFRYFFPRKWQLLRGTDGSALYDPKKSTFFYQFPFLFLAFCIALLKYGRKADIVHCNWSFTALAALPLRWIFKIPVVLTTRGSDLRLIPRFLNRFIFSNVDAVIDCFGPDYRKLFANIPANYVRLPVITSMPKKMPTKTGEYLDSNEFLIVLISRFDSVKYELYGMAFFTLLASLAKISKKYAVKCVYVGDGPLKAEIERSSVKHGLGDIVTFVGYQDNVYQFIQAADLVLGGVGLNAVSQEASVLGKVQLMPRIKNWYENIWFDKQNVLLYEAHDVESLIHSIEFAIENPDEMKKISKNIRDTVKTYVRTIDEGGKDYLKIFKTAIKKLASRN